MSAPECIFLSILSIGVLIFVGFFFWLASTSKRRRAGGPNSRLIIGNGFGDEDITSKLKNFSLKCGTCGSSDVALEFYGGSDDGDYIQVTVSVICKKCGKEEVVYDVG